jgi:hypothetical protein
MSDPQWQESQASKAVRKTFSAATEMAGDYLIGLAMVKFPFLGLPFIKQAFNLIVKNIIEDNEERGELLIKWFFIDKESDAKKDEYNKALAEFEEVKKNNPTKEQRDEALKKTRERMGKLIRFPVK